MSLVERLSQVEARGERAVLLTVIGGDDVGAKRLVVEDGESGGDGPPELDATAGEVIRGGRNRVLDVGARRVLAEVYLPPPRLLIYGAVDTAEALCRAAKLLGWRTIVADARAAYTTPGRIPSADELVPGWPQPAFAEVAPDHQTAVVILTHDAKFDVPALIAALDSDAFYVGALGSRRNQDKRRERLREEGVDEAQLERLSGPCGLDVGAETQEETALSILAEILAVRAGRAGGRLAASPGRIHVQADEPVST